MSVDVQGMTPLLYVFDMPTSIKFYCEVLGFQIAITDGKPAPDFDWALLRLDGAELMLNTAYDGNDRPALPDPRRVTSHQDIELYFAAPDVDAIYTDLSAKGIDLKTPTVAPYGMKQLRLRDPDGFGLCFQWRVEQPMAAG